VSGSQRRLLVGFHCLSVYNSGHHLDKRPSNFRSIAMDPYAATTLYAYIPDQYGSYVPAIFYPAVTPTSIASNTQAQAVPKATSAAIDVNAALDPRRQLHWSQPVSDAEYYQQYLQPYLNAHKLTSKSWLYAYLLWGNLITLGHKLFIVPLP
jgi:hypothetical protein